MTESLILASLLAANLIACGASKPAPQSGENPAPEAASTDGRSMSLFQEDGTFRLPPSAFRLPQNGQVATFDGPPSARRAIVVVFATSMQLERAQMNSEREEPKESAAVPDWAE